MSKITFSEAQNLHNQNKQIDHLNVITSRGLVFNNNKMLLVKDAIGPWHIPGGWVDMFENLTQTCKREIYEETGLIVDISKLVHIDEFYDNSIDQWGNICHRFDFIFLCIANKDQDFESINNWVDPDNNLIQHKQFFSIPEILSMENALYPDFIKDIDLKNPIQYLEEKNISYCISDKKS